MLRQVQRARISLNGGTVVEGIIGIATLSFDCNGTIFGGIAASAPNASEGHARP